MKVNKTDLVRFLRLVAIKGELENKEVILDVTEREVETLSSSKGNICAVMGKFSGTFNTISRLAVGDLKGLVDLISKFEGEEIELIKKDNKLILSSNGENLVITLTLKNPDYILNTLTKEKFMELLGKSEGNYFTLNSGVINKLTEYSNSIKTDELVLVGEGNRLDISIASRIKKDDKEEVENEILASFTLPETVKPFDIKVSKILLDILNTVGKDLNISILNAKPIVIKYFEENKLEVTYLLAQLKK